MFSVAVELTPVEIVSLIAPHKYNPYSFENINCLQLT